MFTLRELVWEPEGPQHRRCGVPAWLKTSSHRTPPSRRSSRAMLAASSVMALAEEIRTSMWSFLRTHLHPRAAQKALSLIASHPRVARAGGDAHERQLAQPARVRNAPNRSKRRNDTLGGSPWCPLPGRPVVEQSGIEGLLFSLVQSFGR